MRLGRGAIVANSRRPGPLELWNLNDPDNPINPCVDTDGQAAPWATGDATVSGHDNDLFVSLTRANVFGEIGRIPIGPFSSASRLNSVQLVTYNIQYIHPHRAIAIGTILIG